MLLSRGYPETFCDLVTKNLNTAFPTGAVLCGVFAVHCFRKNLGHRGLTGTSCSGKQVRMADPVRPQLILQCRHDMILTLDIGKSVRAEFPV